jgi:cell shape-determining protein MreD
MVKKIWKNKWIQASVASLVVILLGAWSFNDSVVARNGFLWIFIQGYLAGGILTAMIYIILNTFRQKNYNSIKKIEKAE